MSSTEPFRDIEADNDRALNTLVRAITLAQDQFALIVVRCNYVELRNRIVVRLKERCPVPLQTLTLPETAKTLYTTIQHAMAPPANESPPPQALMIFGLESVAALDQVLVATNIVREELRKTLPFPLVLWVNDRVLHTFDRLAPDLKSWAGNAIIQFDLTISELIHSLKDHTDRLFASILDVGGEWVLSTPPFSLRSNALRRTELEFALNDIHASGQPLEPELQADLDFLLGRDAQSQGELEMAQECYQRSLEFWQDNSGNIKDDRKPPFQSSYERLPSALERAACILVHLGLCWRSYAVMQRTAYIPACEEALAYFQRSLEMFEQANRLDLIAKFIIPQAEVLQKLERWDELEILARNALVLHKLYADPVRQARDHGFLAEVALSKQHWMSAKQHVEAALSILEDAESGVSDDDLLIPHVETSLELARRYHQGWYLLLLARAEGKLGNGTAAIDHLETARNQSYAQDDPQLYIQILRMLRSLYFAKGRYLEAFYTKQTRRLIEHQFHFRAFVGALRLQPQHRLAEMPLGTPSLVDVDAFMAQEIAASGRQQDVDRLVARLGRNDYKLTVIHGPSGVGKSSIVKAGLVPALKDSPIGERIALPIVLESYSDWQNAITSSLDTFEEEVVDRSAEPEALTDKALNPVLLDRLRRITDRNQLPILIFDQFEEFFFVNDKLPQRRPFYQFFYGCLNLEFVKVVLSLREDYLHYLLEFQRLTQPVNRPQLDSITDILSNSVRYPLRDFSPQDARSVIKSLTTQAQFYLDDELVDELVRDLAGELDEVRPIELQVVGAQLQAENITTLADYRRKGPKEKLVARSLESVIEDCGPENEPAARLVLYLLTNENGTRPLKTRAELVAELTTLDQTDDIDRLDLVLEVLVGSGLVFLVPEMPADRYQLVHDYLVGVIRQQQQVGLVSQLEREREQRKLAEERQQQSEERLNLVLQQLVLVQQQKLKQARFSVGLLRLAFVGLVLALVTLVLAIEARFQVDVPGLRLQIESPRKR